MVKAVTVGMLLLAASASLGAQETGPIPDLGTRVREINAAPAQWENRRIEVVGVTDRYVESATDPQVRFFYLRDLYGDAVLVRTTADLPDPRVYYRLSGTISLSRSGTPYVAEETRLVVPAEMIAPYVSPPPGDEEVVLPPPSWFERNWRYLALAAALLLLALALVVNRRRRSGGVGAGSRPVTPPPSGTGAGGFAARAGSTARPEAAASDLVDGRTVRFYSPPPGTVKLLGGYFEIRGDDKDKGAIRLFAGNTGNGQTEITFGRQDGPPYQHVQLKVPSVSRLQARVRVNDGRYEIRNESKTNPTLVNGSGIEEWTSLKEGDVVAMGEANFVFHGQ